MRPFLTLAILALLFAGAYADSRPSPGRLTGGAVSSQAIGETAPSLEVQEAVMKSNEPHLSTSAPLYFLNWYSVNGGGATSVVGTNFRMGVSAGQAAAGFVTGTNFRMGVGYWYGAAGGACPIALSGDVNLSSTITSADIIALVNYVFKGGAAPLPCPAAGDVNCSGTVTSADIIALVNYVFKGGAAPCDICTVIPSLWSCP